jgi:hypothetical protein
MAILDDDPTDNDGPARFTDFMRLADALHMHPDERCDILGVSVETWRALVRGTADEAVLRSERVSRRLAYAMPLMQRRLENESTEPLTPPLP